MVKKKKSPVKISKAAAKPRASKSKSRRKHTSRASHVAAKTHAASVTYRDRSPYASSTTHHHTPRRHSASIIKAIILFLGFVLLLAILANIFAPSIERQNFNKNTSPYMHNNQNRSSGGYTHSPAPSTNRPANNNNYQMNKQYVSPPPSANEAEPSVQEEAPVQQYRRIVPEESYSAPQQ